MSTSELLDRLEHIRNCFSDNTPLLYIVNLFEDLYNGNIDD